MNSIECRSVSCRYGASRVLDEVTFAVPAGQWCVIMGPSAGGKTTLLRAIAGLEPIEAGEILIDERVVTSREALVAPHERGLGLLFQEPSLWPHLSVRANVELGLSRLPDREARRTAAIAWLDRLGAAHLAEKFPGKISGGERRLAELARTLAAGPKILLLDEPTTHLDVHLREGLMKLLRELHDELGLTTLCVTHEVERWLSADDRTLVIEGGRIVHDGSLGEIQGGSEYTKTLAREVKR